MLAKARIARSAAGILIAAVVISQTAFQTVTALAAEAPLVKSAKSGSWSKADTWDGGRAPQEGDRVLIRPGHHVLYDADSKQVIRMIQIAGTLDFARDKNTQLDVGLIKIAPSEDMSEEGFDCIMSAPPAAGSQRPALLVGTPEEPIAAKYTAFVRLHYIEGMNKETCPAIVCCGGQMDFHGSPLQHTWVKLDRTVPMGATSLATADIVDDWKPGDLVMITTTVRPRGGFTPQGGSVADESQTELRRIVEPGSRFGFGTPRRPAGNNTATDGANKPATDKEYADKDKPAAPTAPQPNPGFINFPVARGKRIQFEEPLKFEHYAEGEYRGEVANLSRNVVVESADPDGVRGHTMYHAGSAGSISYAEFRHLGKRDVLGKYAIHFHQVGDSMRGSYVIGASIWDSANRWITIHGTNYLVVRDCVGYKSIGHGFFLEDGTEVQNVLDHNLAVQALHGKPLPKEIIPFDENRGAGFWWANCENSFVNNVAAECDEYGYRFECKKTDDYDTVQPIMQADGSSKSQDIRLLPFVKFENNEAHSQPFFGLNLRGITRPAQGLDFYALNETLTKEATAAIPPPRSPFWIHNYKAWETNWAFHGGTSGVFLDGFDAFRCEYGIWRSVIDRHTWLHVSFKEMSNKDLHMPFSIGVPDEEKGREIAYFQGIPRFQDDAPPTTVITHVVRSGDEIVVHGTTSDSSGIKSVTVNGRAAHSLRDHFAEWEISFAVPQVLLETAKTSDGSAHKAGTSDATFTIKAAAEDEFGHVEARPHIVEVRYANDRLETMLPQTAWCGDGKTTQTVHD